MPDLFKNMSPEDISQLLVDCATGKLAAEEAKAVEKVASEVPALHEELIMYQGLVRAGNPVPDVTAPGELGWARLSKAIDAEEQQRSASTPQAANDNSRNIWRFAAFAFGFLFFAQTAIQFASQDNGVSDPQYLPVSETSEGAILKIAFVPTATEQDIRTLLSEVDGQIVRGPSSIGLYDVQFEDEAKRDGAQQVLAASDDIVESFSPAN